MQIVSELPAGTNWNFDVHWYPKIPGIISASSFDRKIGIYNIEVRDIVPIHVSLYHFIPALPFLFDSYD